MGRTCPERDGFPCNMARSPSSSLFLGEGSPTKIDYRKRVTLIPTSLLEDLDVVKILLSPIPLVSLLNV